ncbi:hypothetical protein N8855_01595, partial [bacterium]|nr:hypothetical protein [bacterium]
IIYSLTVFLALTALAYADDPLLMGEYKRHDLRAATLCIEGHIVIVAHSDVGKGGGLHMMQLQHVVEGKILPMTCDLAGGGQEGEAKSP